MTREEIEKRGIEMAADWGSEEHEPLTKDIISLCIAIHDEAIDDAAKVYEDNSCCQCMTDDIRALKIGSKP